MIYLDTHVVVWLYAGRTDLLPPLARSLIDEHDLLVSPIVALELQYLHEAAKIAEPAAPVLRALAGEIGMRQCPLPFEDVAEMALQEAWTRDPFDRIAVAQARLRGAPLLTKDRDIHEHFADAVWDEDADRS